MITADKLLQYAPRIKNAQLHAVALEQERLASSWEANCLKASL